MHVTYERLWSWRVEYLCRSSRLPSDQTSGEGNVGDDQITCETFTRVVEAIRTQGGILSSPGEGLASREEGADGSVSNVGLERASCKRMLELELWIDILRDKHATTLTNETRKVLEALETELGEEVDKELSAIDLSSNETVFTIKLLKKQIGNLLHLQRTFPDKQMRVRETLEAFLEVDSQANATAEVGIRQLIMQLLGLDSEDQPEASTTDPVEHCLYVAGSPGAGEEPKGLLIKFLEDSQGINNVHQLLCEVWKGTGVPTPVAKMLLRPQLEGRAFVNLLNFLTPLFSNNRKFWPEVKDAVAIVCSMESHLVPSLTGVLESLPVEDRQKNFVSLMKKLQFLSDDDSLLRISVPRLAALCEKTKFPGLAEILCKAKSSKFLSFIYNLSDSMQEPRLVASFHFHKEISASRLRQEMADAKDKLQEMADAKDKLQLGDEMDEKSQMETIVKKTEEALKIVKETEEALKKLQSKSGTSTQDEALGDFSAFLAVADLSQVAQDGWEYGTTGVMQALNMGAGTLGFVGDENVDESSQPERDGVEARAEGSVADDPEQELVNVWGKGGQEDFLRCVVKVCCRHKHRLLQVLDVEQNGYKVKLLSDFWREYLGLDMRTLACSLKVLQGILEQQSLKSESEELLAQLFWSRCERVGSVERGALDDALQYLDLKRRTSKEDDQVEATKRGTDDQRLEWSMFFAAAEAKERELQAHANLTHWILATVDFAEAATMCFKPEPGQRWDSGLAEYMGGDAPDKDQLKRKFEESLVEAMREQAGKLWEKVQELKQPEQPKQGFETDKFLENTPIMMLGGVEYFHQGLEVKIGFPHPNVMEMMRVEHQEDYTFVVSNYGEKTTTPKAEWALVMMDDKTLSTDQASPRDPSLAADPRVLRPLKHYLDLKVVQQAGLTTEEVIAVRLYTGPMYVLYNAKLRGFGVPDDTLQLLNGGAYVTTLHAINSAILKLARVSKVPDDRVTYRGLKVQLPRSFWRRDARGCKGGVEMSFCSTTTKLRTAIHYADDGNHLPTIFEVRVGQIDFGASVQPLSQYPGEEEVLFPPLSNFEVRGRPYMAVKEGVEVLLVPLRVNVNMKALTVDELIARRQRHHVTMISHFVMESKRFIRETQRRAKEGDARDPAPRAKRGDRGASPDAPDDEMPLEMLLVKQLEREQDQKTLLPATHFNHDPSFREFLDDAVELKQLTQRRIRLLRRVQKWGSKAWVQFVKPRRYLNYATLADEPVVWAQVTTQFSARNWAAVLAREQDTFREDMSVVECEAAFQLMAVSKEGSAQVVSDRVGARARLEGGRTSRVLFLRKHSNVEEMETKLQAEDRHRNLISQLSQLHAAGLRFIADYHLFINDFVSEGPQAFKRNRLKEYMVHSETISKELLFTPCTVQEVQAFLDAVETFPNKQPEPEAAGGSSRRNTAPLHLLLCTDPTCRARAATVNPNPDLEGAAARPASSGSEGVLCLMGHDHRASKLSPDLAKLMAPRLAENKAIKEVRFGTLSLKCERFSEQEFSWTPEERRAIADAEPTNCTSGAILISELMRDKATLRTLDLRVGDGNLPFRVGEEAELCLASALLTLPGLTSFNGITVTIANGCLKIQYPHASDCGDEFSKMYTTFVRETSRGLISVSEVVGQGTAACSLLTTAMRPHEAAFVCMRVSSLLAADLDAHKKRADARREAAQKDPRKAAPHADPSSSSDSPLNPPPTPDPAAAEGLGRVEQLEGLAAGVANQAWTASIQGDAVRRRCKLAFVAKECGRLAGELERLTVAAGAIVNEQDALWLFNCPPLAPLNPLAYLKSLVLNGNALGRQGCAQLSFALGTMSQVEELYLGNCHIDNTACVALSVGLRLCPSLRRLDLANAIPRWTVPGRNTVGDSGVDALIPALKYTTVLEVLSLCGNQLTPAAGLKLVKGVKYLEKLREVNLTHNVIFALQFEMEWRMNEILSGDQQGGKTRSRTPAKAYVVWLPHVSKFVWETASDTAVAAAGMVAGSQDESQVAAAEEQPQVTTDNAGEPAVAGMTWEPSADFASGRGH